MSTGSQKSEFDSANPFQPGSGTCRRCEQPGHWQDDPACPWLQRAVSKAAHLARIARYVERWIDGGITEWQKREFITQENQVWNREEKRTA